MISSMVVMESQALVCCFSEPILDLPSGRCIRSLNHSIRLTAASSSTMMRQKRLSMVKTSSFPGKVQKQRLTCQTLSFQPTLTSDRMITEFRKTSKIRIFVTFETSRSLGLLYVRPKTSCGRRVIGSIV